MLTKLESFLSPILSCILQYTFYTDLIENSVFKDFNNDPDTDVLTAE